MVTRREILKLGGVSPMGVDIMCTVLESTDNMSQFDGNQHEPLALNFQLRYDSAGRHDLLVTPGEESDWSWSVDHVQFVRSVLEPLAETEEGIHWSPQLDFDTFPPRPSVENEICDMAVSTRMAVLCGGEQLQSDTSDEVLEVWPPLLYGIEPADAPGELDLLVSRGAALIESPDPCGLGGSAQTFVESTIMDCDGERESPPGLQEAYFVGRFTFDRLRNGPEIRLSDQYTCTQETLNGEKTVSIDLVVNPTGVAGKFGDVITVDLSALSGCPGSSTDVESYRFAASQRFSDEAYPGGHDFPANELGYVAQIEDWEATLRDEGKFYFVPVRTGTGTFSLVPADSDEDVDREDELALTLTVSDDYSTTGADAVTFESGAPRKNLDQYRQQQRLKYLGFPGFSDDLVVNGDSDDAETDWARGLFNHAVSEDTPDSGGAFAMEEFTGRGQAFINAENAPHWENINDVLVSSGILLHIDAESAEWGTNWTRELLEDFVTINPDLTVVQISNRYGGFAGETPSDEVEHEAGMDVDVKPISELSYENPFYRTHTLGGGQKYVAARTPDDPAGERHVVVEDPAGSYRAGPFDSDGIPDDAVAHDSTNLDDPEFLTETSHLLTDNVEIGYDTDEVIDYMSQFIRSKSIGGVGQIYFNDPRTWMTSQIEPRRGYADKFHVSVLPPEPEG